MSPKPAAYGLLQGAAHALLLSIALAGLGCSQDPAFTEDQRQYTAIQQATADVKTNPGDEPDKIDRNHDGIIDDRDNLPAADSPNNSSAIPGNPVPTDPGTIDELKRLPKFGLLVNDLHCSQCHVTTIGDVASTRDVPALWTGSEGLVTGKWLAAGAFNATGITAQGGIHTNYRGPELPIDKTAAGQPAFPVINFAAVEQRVSGQIRLTTAPGANINRVYEGNLVLIGTEQNPIELSKDVLVKGDLVIAGVYRGIGTIYVTGRIYIPRDLTALRTAFPFSADPAVSMAKAEQQMDAMQNNTSATDALGLATPNSIFMGDLEKQETSDAVNVAVTVYNHPSTPANRLGEALGVDSVFNWFPGGKSAYNSLYGMASGCSPTDPNVAQQHRGSLNILEAFLYAGNTVAGISRRTSYSIRGGVIADYFHVVSGAVGCAETANPVHHRPGNRNYIEYDYRLATGRLQILEAIAEHFPKTP